MSIEWLSQLVASLRGPGAKRSRKRLNGELQSSRRRNQPAIQRFETLESRITLTANFGAAVNFAAGVNTYSVMVGDFNADGKADLATANANSNDVSLLLGNGAGSFGAATNFAVGTSPRSVTVGDFNADGRPDLATANFSSNTVSVLLNNGVGGFAAATSLAVGSLPFSVTVGDFDGNGKADLAVTNLGSNSVSVLLGNGAGGFASAGPFTVGSSPNGVTVGDFNADGKADLATANYGSNDVSVLLGNGAGGFAAAANFAAGTQPVAVTVGDFNADGKADIAAANLGSNNVSVLLGNGAGGLAAAVNFAVGTTPTHLTAGDLDGDGRIDLAVANTGSNNVSVLVGTGTGSFAAAANFAVGGTPRWVAVGDFNADGKPDLATACGTGTVSILLNTNAAVTSLPFQAATNFAVGNGPTVVTVGDFNGDGKPDIATGNNFTSPTVSVRLGTGTGSFSAPTTVAVPNSPFSVTLGDFNGDGKPDIATANRYANNVSVLLGNGSGGFSGPTNFPVGNRPVSVTVGDFNRDGKPDIASANANSSNVSVLLGNGAGGFSAPTNFTVGTKPYSVTVGDFNGDGKPDLATANRDLNNVSVLLGDGAGSFSAPTNFTVGAKPYYLTVGDFNGDGKPDVATANTVSNNVSVLLGNGAGSFGAATNFTVGTKPVSVTVGDFNGDGKPDLATANYSSNNVSVLLGNGAGSFSGLTNFTVGNNPFSVAVADFNGDGKPDLAAANTGSANVSVLLGGTAAPAVNLSVSAATGTEAGTTVITVTATAASAVSGAQTVSLAVTGTNITASDYALSNSTITIPNGGTTGTVTFTVKDDLLNEGNETATLTISSPSAGITLGTTLAQNVAITDDDNAGTSNYGLPATGAYRVVRNGSTIEIYNSTPVLVASRAMGTEAVAINGTSGNDSLTIDLSGGNFTVPITFNGGSQTSAPGDILTLTGGTFANGTFAFTNANDGTINLTGNSQFSYTGLEPIVSTGTTINDLILTFNGGAETITLTDEAGAAMTIDSPLSESLTFANPSSSLTINAGTGDDIVNITSVDAAFNAALTINGDANNDTVTLTPALSLASLTVTAEAINLNSGSLTTTGNQTYNGAVVLGTDTTAAGAQVAFNGSINSASSVATYVGSYAVSSGPSWELNPPVYSARQAAALLFGGVFSQYAISTNANTVNPATITLTGNYSIWGISGPQVFPQDYSLDLGAPGYNNPGGSNTAASAYVNDNAGGAVNYVWLAGGGSTPRSLTVNSSGTTTFGGSVGGTNALSSLSVTTTDVAAGDIATTTSVTVNNTGTASNISGVISGASATLTKSGTGTLTLSGASANTYGGVTTVSAGTLLVNKTHSGTGAFNVNNSATLGGTGSIAGVVNVNNTARLAPGASPETLASGTVTFTSGTFFDVEIGGTSPGNGITGYDQLIVTGTVNLGSATLNVQQFAGFSVSPGVLQTYTIIDNNGTADAVVGTFSGLAEGSAVIYAGGTLYISYAGGDGNDVVLSSQPLMQGTALADTFLLTGNGTTFTVTRTNTNGTITATYTSPPLINILGAEADDLLTVDSSGTSTDPIPAGGVFYDGQTQDLTSRLPNSLGDVLRMLGTSAQTATYLANSTTNGAGTVTVTGIGVVNFTGLEPVDVIGFGTANVTFPNGDDVLSIANGFDAATGLLDALIVSGTSGGIGFEQVHLRNNTTVNIDTTTSNGSADIVTIASATNVHGNVNFNVTTGAAGGATERIDITGAATFTGNVSLTSARINSNATLTASATGSVTLTANVAGITDGNGATVNVITQDLVASSVSGVAALADALETTISKLEAVGGSGGVYVTNSSALTIGTISATIGVSASGLDIVVTAAGSLIVSELVSNTGGGNVTLAAQGTTVTDDLDINANIATSGGSGNINLYAGDTITVQGSPTARTISADGFGAILLSASTNYSNGTPVNGFNAAAASTNGRVVMQDGSIIQSHAGNITLRGDGSILVGTINANSNGIGSVGDVIITADYDGVGTGLSDLTGAIVDNTAAEGVNITGDEAALRAAEGVGDGVASNATDLETALNTLAAVTESGDINIVDVGSLTIGTFNGLSGVIITDASVGLNSGNDHITVLAGSILVSDVVTNNDGGNLTLRATGSDVTLNAGVSITGAIGAVTIDAVNDVLGNASGDITTANGNVSITANTDSSTNPGFNDDGTIQMSGDITAGTGVITFSLADCDGYLGISAPIADGEIISASDVIKNGVGILRLNGAANTYTGTTNVNAGTLLVNGSLTADMGIVNVNSGGTLGGNGTIGTTIGARDVFVRAGGILDPGDVNSTTCVSLPGRLTSNGDVDFADGSRFRVQLNSLVAGTGYDQLVVNGSIDIGDGSNAAQQTILDTNVGFGAPIGSRFEIVVNDDVDNVLPDPGAQFVETDGVTPIPEGGFFFSGGTSTFFNITYQADATGGINNGGTNDIVLTAPGRFDLNGVIFQDFLYGNPIESPTAIDWQGVPEHTVKTPSTNHGWDMVIPSFVRSGPTALLRDGHYAGDVPTTFQVDVVPGQTYRVVLQVGDLVYLHDNDQITVYDGANLPSTGQVRKFNTAAGDFATIVFDSVSIGTSGKLYIQFVDGGPTGEGGDRNFVVNAIEIRPTNSVGSLTLTGATLLSPVDADGLMVDTYNGAGAPPNSLITVATTNGTVTSADQDPNTSGVQVLANGLGNFSFTVRRPTSSTAATISASEVSGLSFGSVLQNYQVANLRRFDFNRGTLSPTATGFIGVAGNSTYTIGKGYGWQSVVVDTDRGTGGGTFTDLRRDLHIGVASNTFSFEVVMGRSYGLRVYVGDYSILHDQIQVSVEGAAAYTIVSLAPGVFDLTVTTGVSGGDSILDVTFSDIGGSDRNWVVNGIDVDDTTVAPVLPGAFALHTDTTVNNVSGGDFSLSPSDVTPFITEATARWASIVDNYAAILDVADYTIRITDLPAGLLSLSDMLSQTICLDVDADGFGWYVDPNPVTDDEFLGLDPTPAGIDLLTVVTHEFGHLLGIPEADPQTSPSNVMLETLPTQTRRQTYDMSVTPGIVSPGGATSALRPTMTWTEVPGASEYEVWVTMNPSTNPYHKATVTQTSYTPPVDFSIGKFNLWVRAKFSAGYGPWTQKYTFVINTAPVLPSITRMQPTLQPTINWTAVPGAVKYDVWFNDASRGLTQVIRDTNVTGTSFTPSADLPLGTYRAWVRGIAADGTAGAWSFGIEFVTRQAPTVTQGQNPTFDRTPTFAWDALPGAATYEVFIRDRNTGVTTVDEKAISGLTFTPSTPLPDGPYRWWVMGTSAEGVRSFWTAPMDIYIGGRTDVLTPAGSTGSPTPTLSWRAVDGAVRYDLWVNLIGGPAQIIRQQNLTDTSYTPATALPTGTYRVWVRAVSSTGEVGPWSIEVNFTIAEVTPEPEAVFAPDAPLLTSLKVLKSKLKKSSVRQRTAEERADQSVQVQETEESSVVSVAEVSRETVTISVSDDAIDAIMAEFQNLTL